MSRLWPFHTISRTYVLYVLANLAIGFVALEWILRAFVFDPTAAYVRTPGWVVEVHTNGLLPHVDEDYMIGINPLGIRGALPASGATPKIAVLGGSTVEDWVLPDRRTWVQQFADRLRTCAPDVWAGNYGKAGVNARHHLIQFDEIAHTSPHLDMFVVLMGLNDFLYDFHIHHPLVTPDGWWRRQALMYDHNDEGHLAIVALAKRLYRSWTSVLPVSDFGDYQESLRVAHAKVRDDQWVDTLPDLTPHLGEYRKTIAALKALADKYGAPIVFVTQPFVWSDTMSAETKAQLFAGFIGADMESPQTRWYTSRALMTGLAAYNATLLQACKEDNLLCVDAAQTLPHEAKYYFDDFHFSTLGAAALGSIVADVVKTKLPGCSRP